MEEKKEEEKKEEEKKEQSEELKAIITAIEKYGQAHDNRMIFHAIFMAVDENDMIIDDGMFAFGPKEPMIDSIKDMLKHMEKDEKEFINW